MPRKSTKVASKTYIDRLEEDILSNQSKVSLVLGVLIVLVVGILLYNYFNKGSAELGPSQQTQQSGQEKQQDVSPSNLPGKYTVKEGDTLFLIAEKYYQDGFKYPEIAKANSLQDPNTVEVGQILNIPKGTATPEAFLQASVLPSPTTQEVNPVPANEKGANPAYGTQSLQNFGPAIIGNTYTVQEGDWLSKISARAYGDIMQFPKIAVANGIANPDLIFPGQVLKIPR